MKITRKFTVPGADPFASVTWIKRSSKITNPDGTVVFEMKDAEVPETWSQLATDIMVSKYFRKAGVPRPDGTNGPETSARQVIHRLAGCWRYWGEKHNYFDTAEDAQAFYDELAYMMVHQMCAPNSPQWFNTGLNFAYGITGPAQGHWIVDPKTGEPILADDAYTHSQPHACQPYDAPISTPMGPVFMGEIVTGNLVGLEVFDGTGNGTGTTRVKAVKANGEKPVYAIVLKNGIRVEATADHVVLALKDSTSSPEWLRVDQLVPGARMQVSTVTSVKKDSSERDVDEAAMAGWLQGDGFVGQYTEGTNRSLTVELMTIDRDEYEYVMGLVGRAFEGVHFHVRDVPSQDSELEVKRIRLYGEKLRPFVEKYSLLRESSDLSVPAAIRTAGKTAQYAYLRSLFQADGTVRLRERETRTSDVVLTTVSPALARGVQALLLNLGIYSRVQTGVETRENRRTPYFVSLGYAHARKHFQDAIGFISEDKREKLARSCSDAFPGKELPALRVEEIVRLELIGTQPVYDIQTESGQYLCNNVIVHNCFIQSVSDELVNEGGIMDLWVREARLFKYGSGTGTNFSTLRGEGEKLSGGGRSSGLMSWLRIGDRAASAIKSGGTTRRAAKMVCLDMDHPDIQDFVNWKVREEIKVQAMVEGFNLLKKHDPALAAQCEKLKLKLDYDFNGEAYQTVSGQNSNNSVRIPDSFFEKLDADAPWQTTWRTNGKPAKSINSRELWDDIAIAAWRCADPGVQFDTTINAWHTCPSAGRINASNPCSEYLFLDNTACNLASLNVLKFYDAKSRVFDIERFEHGVDLWIIVLEISVLMAAFPSREIAELSYRYRTTGLGYANLGAMLMQAGVAYDSDEGRAICACLTAILTGRSYRQSALIAKEHGPFPGYAADRANMLRVMRNHRRAALGLSRDSGEYEDLHIRPVPIDHSLILLSAKAGAAALANAASLLSHSVQAWDEALSLGEQFGYRNAQTTVIAPTGTIGLLMDCDTTGVEPDFALVKFKKLAGGGYFKIANESVRPALRTLGYTESQTKDIMAYLLGTLSLEVPLPQGVKGARAGDTLAQFLLSKGLSAADLQTITDSLPGVFELSFAFSAWAIPAEALSACGIDPVKAKGDASFNLLLALGLSEEHVDRLNLVICGTSTVEGAPHLKAEHQHVFDCASKCGRLGRRFIAPEGHIRMMAAAQPFISGAISKTINLPNEASVDDIKNCYRMSWELGLKANALYRDGCKLSQPLSSTTDEAKKESGREAAVEPAKVEVVPEPVVARDSKPKATRRRLPDTRRSLTHKFNVAGHEGYLTVGLYEDNQPGELFITMSKEGSTIGGLMDSLGTATSVSLQYGVPVKSLVDKFSHQRFEPAGMTENRDIPFAKSLVDYIFRWMGMQFVPGYLEENSPHYQMMREEAMNTGRLSGPEPAREAVASLVAHVQGKDGVLDTYMKEVSDAPACDVCGNVTVRSGTCYKCLSCGNSLGCS